MRSQSKFRERRYAYVYLLNLLIPIAFLSLFPLAQIVIGGVLIAAFGVVYIATFQLKSWRYVLIGLQILLMMILIGYFNGGYVWMIFYPVASIAILFEGRQMFIMVGGMIVLFIAENYVLSLFRPYTLADWLLFLAAVIAGIATFYGTIWQKRTISSREQLRAANLHIERLTKVAERERISRDLHDVMGHELSMITLKSQLASKLIDRDPERATSEIGDIENAARQALSRVREYISAMRQMNLAAEWKDAVRLLGAAGIHSDARWGLHWDAEKDLSPLSFLSDSADAGGAQHTLAMCLREAVTNLVRYSGATHCELQLQQADGRLCLKVCDNGSGIRGTVTEQSGNGGNGIKGMRARVASMGGQLTLWSNGELIGASRDASKNPSPWSTGVALVIEVPCQITDETAEVRG
ncbi:sensor histidine kinase [Alicyclobacillus curvatus]|nr:sensor histidine kinase [Alicyclobacillus curvatus]